MPETPTAASSRNEPRKRKQAVVIVHGMGEQKPLETLRGFVETVWGAAPVPRDEPSPDDVWLVPDMRAGLKELARVTTRRNKDGIATDFYELYWSDLLVGNTMAQINAWVRGLLLRWPHQVPRESFALWLVLWVLVGVIVALAAYVGLTGSLTELWKLISEAEAIQNRWTAAASVVAGVVLFLLLRRWLASALVAWTNADRVFPGIWAETTPRQASASTTLSWIAAILVPAAVGLAFYCWFPWSVLATPKAWALIVAALIAAALSAWVVPVFGDVARYVRTSPDAVSARSQIRERGVELLRALHGPTGGAADRRYDYGDETGYERIVVVGHSLGSIVAYDVLRLFWEERGPTSRNPAKDEALARLRATDGYCRSAAAKGTFDAAAFRVQQGKLAAILAEQPGTWRISDFITLGSPLTHAEFLVSRDRAAFEERKAERLFPTCPPMLEPGKLPSFLYSNLQYAHHAAMFSAMRWTNIHDPGAMPFLGDFISGPCRPNFGPGIVDVAVAIDRGGPFGRLVTHTDYWNPRAAGSASDAEGEKLGLSGLGSDPKAHITLLRKALDLR
ncbi:MAG: hypothetical protein F9K19_25800 [Rhizobiaceae bacterium]|nr:MAG: hypothetical protein F9K19_25800 [Rhizobiaceae bacterium]CAG0964158.1 hypothetical protein RHIZO_00863 [Rhizobiaceae bacterium]